MAGDLQKLVNELADELLRWIEWLLVPLAMLWLTFLWPFLDPKKLQVGQQASPDKIKAGWATGFLLALCVFLVVFGWTEQKPAQLGTRTQLSWPIIWCGFFGLLIGLRVRYIWKKWGEWKSEKSRQCTALIVCGVTAFSLTSLACYYLWGALHPYLLTSYLGLILGYRLYRLVENSS